MRSQDVLNGVSERRAMLETVKKRTKKLGRTMCTQRLPSEIALEVSLREKEEIKKAVAISWQY